MIVDCAVYEAGQRKNGLVELDHAFEQVGGDNSFVWIGLLEPTEEEFDTVRREFGLHDLAVEDAIKAHQRPKLEAYGDTLFVVLKTAKYEDKEEVVVFGELLLFVGKRFLITVRHGGRELHDVRDRLECDPELLRCGPGAVLHAIVDRVVDDYGLAMEGLENDIEELEEEVFSTSRQNRAERIYKLKREVLHFIRATAPLVEPTNRLALGHYDLIPGQVRPYFRDVNDHVVRIREQLEGFSDLLTSILEANLTQVGVGQNEDMRKISAWVAVAAVPTMIAGIYGMNFEHMPELRWTFGYPLVLAVMLTVCGSLFRAFKRAGWL